MIDVTAAGLDPRFFHPRGPHGVVELAPQRCPEGHLLEPGRVLVAAHPCSCTTSAHRIWRCWQCDRVWVRPACARHPEWPAWLPGGPG